MDLKGTVDVPVVGSVDKRVLIGVGGVAVVFVGWRFYQSRSAAAYDPEAEPVDPGMEDPGVLPSVAGAVRDDNAYGLADGSGATGTDAYGFHGTSDAQWTQYATAQLTASDSWSYTAIVTALGKYLKSKPLSTDEQMIVQAALAVAGPPPEHPNLPTIPGGNVKITVAPTGVKASGQTTSSVVLSWNPVAGAQSYRAYRSGASTNVGTTDAPNTSMTISGLQPNTEYSFQIAADSMGDVPGPKSSVVKAKTKPVTLSKPTGVKVSSIAATAATVGWTKVKGATSYRIYVNGHLRGTADGGLSSYRVSGLSKKTTYAVTVAADTTNQEPGPMSAAVRFTTKSK
jgi:hypothetical protein